MSWKVNTAYCELRNYKNVTFISQEHIDSIKKNKDLLDGSFILNIIGGNDDKIINSIKEHALYFDIHEKIGSFAYSTTYRIFKTGEVPKV